MAYNTGFGSANEVLGGSRFVELAPVPCGKAFHEVDTTPYRIPDRLPNPVRPWHEPAAFQSSTVEIIPKLEPLYVHRKPEPWDPDPIYVPEGRIERLADLGLLRFSDDD